MARIELVKPLRHRRFRLLFAGQAVSGIGDWLDYLAIVVLITYTWNEGAGALAALSITMALPWVALAPVAGVLADRVVNKKAVLVGCDLVRAGVVLGYLIAPDLPVLLALVFVKSACGALFNPTQQTTVKLVVPKEDLLGAVSLTVFTSQATKVAGPALGGLVVATWGIDAAFVLDAATFLASAVLLALLRIPEAAERAGARAGKGTSGTAETATETKVRGGYRADLVEGLAFIRRSPVLITVIASLSATVFLVFVFDTLSPLALRQLGLGESALGFTMAAVGTGALMGTLAVSQWGRRLNLLLLMGLAQVVVGVAVAGMGIALDRGAHTSLTLWLVVAFTIGAASAGILVIFPYTLQRETPYELLGRVSSTAMAIPLVLQLGAPVLGALLARWQGVGFTFLLAGPALLLVGVIVTARALGGAWGSTARDNSATGHGSAGPHDRHGPEVPDSAPKPVEYDVVAHLAPGPTGLPCPPGDPPTDLRPRVLPRPGDPGRGPGQSVFW